YEHAASGGIYRYGFAIAPNEAGDLIGESERDSAIGDDIGQAGWFYDSASGTTMPLEFSVRSSDSYSFTRPRILTEQGVVLGSYDFFEGATFVAERAFWWSEQAGFHDLGQLVHSGLTT